MASQDPANAAPAVQFERRWPVALTIGLVVVLLALLPERIRLVPAWVPYLMAFVALVPMIGAELSRGKARWLRIERIVLLAFIVTAAAGTALTLAYLIREMAHPASKVGGVALLASSISVWAINVLTFTLLYWQIDRGGPEARLEGTRRLPDWLFPHTGASGQVPDDWRPGFVDYLFLGYSTATAFSATEVAPLTARAKLLMMAESTFALATLVVVASRAINILGS